MSTHPNHPDVTTARRTTAHLRDLVHERLTSRFPTLTLDDDPVAEQSKLYTSDTNDEFDPDDESWKTCGGGLQASASDLARLGLGLLDGTLLDPADRDEMWTLVGGYAYGWGVDTADHAGERLVGKSGGQPGANTFWLIYPDDDIQVVVLTNRWKGGHSAAGLAKAIGELMLAEL
jgi:CubicO group peptidase (beta-lactamase class C family)